MTAINKGRLLTFGCSMTRGDALDDIWDKTNKRNLRNNNSNHHAPSVYAWPQLLADKMDLDCINKGKSGSSNKQIWHSAVTTNFKENDTVIIQWATYDRWCVISDSDSEVTQINVHQIKEANSIASFFYANLHTVNDMNYDNNLRMSHITMYLNSIGVTVYNLICGSSTQYCEYKQLEFNKTKPLPHDLVKIQLSVTTRANDNAHPCAETHKIFADELYNEIQHGS